MGRTRPYAEKIKSMPKEEIKNMIQSSIELMENKELLKQLADDNTKTKMKQVIQAMMDNINEEQDITELKAQLTKLNTDITPNTPQEKKKRKIEKGFEKETSFNLIKKAKKTIDDITKLPIPERWLPWVNELKNPLVFIDRQDEASAIAMKEKINEAKFNFKIEAKITGIRVTGNKVLTYLADTNQTELYITEMKKLFKDIEPYTPKTLDPMIIIYRVPVDNRIDTFIHDFRKFNSIKPTEKIILHKVISTKSPKTKNIVLRISPAIREEIERKRGLCYYGSSQLNIADYFSTVRCTRCQNYGHTGEKCSSQTICELCTGYHRPSECPIKLEPNKWKCVNCDTTGHAANDRKKCQTYLRHLKFQISITNYSYEYIMM